MILPGVSGSFILLLLGVYFDILAAVNSRDVLVLAIFAIGCGLGLLAFTRLLNYVFEHHRDLTVSFLIGLMVGSLYGLWPFRTFDTISEERIDLAHILPQADMNLLITLLAFLFGSGLILLFYQFERKGAKA
jgi:putative membrane protein